MLKIKTVGCIIKFWFLLGMPGSTKTTVGRIIFELIRTFHPQKMCTTWTYHEMSKDISREIEDKSELGVLLEGEKPKMQAGQLAADSLVMRLIEKNTNQDIANGVTDQFGDGFPRTILQARTLIEKPGIEWSALYFNAPTAVSEMRIARRATKAGRPNEANPEVVQRRMADYYCQTFPVLEYLQGISPERVHEIDATTDILTRVESALTAMGIDDATLTQMMENLQTEGHPANLLMQEALAEPSLVEKTVPTVAVINSGISGFANLRGLRGVTAF